MIALVELEKERGCITVWLVSWQRLVVLCFKYYITIIIISKAPNRSDVRSVEKEHAAEGASPGAEVGSIVSADVSSVGVEASWIVVGGDGVGGVGVGDGVGGVGVRSVGVGGVGVGAGGVGVGFVPKVGGVGVGFVPKVGVGAGLNPSTRNDIVGPEALRTVMVIPVDVIDPPW
jgi:hypothetical protein